MPSYCCLPCFMHLFPLLHLLPAAVNIQDLLNYSGVIWGWMLKSKLVSEHILNMHHINSCFHTEDVRALVQLLFSPPPYRVKICKHYTVRLLLVSFNTCFCLFALLNSDVFWLAFQCKYDKGRRSLHLLNFQVWLCYYYVIIIIICSLEVAAEKK